MSTWSADYTPAAQACLDVARREAVARKSAQVEPEHVLLALLHPDAGSAWNYLATALGDPLPLRQRVEAAFVDLPAGNDTGGIPFGFRAERVLSGAGDVAQQAGARIDSQHLLLGVLEEGGAAALILRQAGVDAHILRGLLRQNRIAVGPATRPAPLRAAPKKKPVLVEGPLHKVLPRLIDWRAVIVLLGLIGAGAWLAAQPENETAGVVLFVFGGWVFSLCAHEFGHALAADLGGDQTVREKGYLSFNPLAYTHPLLSIIMPILFLLLGGIGLPGGAVYIETHRLRSSRWGSIVSAAGPLASLLVALLMALPFILKLVRFDALFAAPGVWGALGALVLLNVWAVLFNLIPIPPLDGFGIVAPWLPPGMRNLAYRFGFLGLWLLIFAFLSIPSFSEPFWNSVFDIVQTLGIDPRLAAYGLSRFMFWR